VSLFPLLLMQLAPDSAQLSHVLNTLSDSSKLWSQHGLRSLSAADAYYQQANNPGDEPYWRGHIWININYLACRAVSDAVS
jgi:mannosyl-oligosaccharide glucosidase